MGTGGHFTQISWRNSEEDTRWITVITELCVLNYSVHRMSDSKHISTYVIHQISDGKCKQFSFMQKMSDSEHIYIYIYIGCPGRNVPDFGRMFLKLKYTDITRNTYIRSWTVTEIMTREYCGLLAVPRTVPVSRDVLAVHCACPSFSLQPAQARSRCDCTYKVLGTLRTTATLVRVFM
jgi:hypothetical protein